MNYLPQFLTVASIHLLAVISPGPDFVMITRNSLVYSRRTGIYSAIGLGLGIGVHVLYCLIGIGLLISQFSWLFNSIQIIGAAYLFYIGYQSLQSLPHSLTIKGGKKIKDLTPLEALRIGFITNVTNPKATIFFLALFTQVIDMKTPLGIQILYGIEMMTATAAWFALVAIIFTHHMVKKQFERVGYIAEKIMGIILIGIALKLLSGILNS